MSDTWPPEDWSIDGDVAKARERRKRRHSIRARRGPERVPGDRDRYTAIDDGEIYCSSERASRVGDLRDAMIPYQYCYGHKTYSGPDPGIAGRPAVEDKEIEVITRFNETYDDDQDDEYLEGAPLRKPGQLLS